MVGPSCHKCKRPGHIARDCRSGGPPSFVGDQGPRRRNKEKCYKCNQFGHFARECKEEGDRCYRCKGELRIPRLQMRGNGGTGCANCNCVFFFLFISLRCRQ